MWDKVVRMQWRCKWFHSRWHLSFWINIIVSWWIGPKRQVFVFLDDGNEKKRHLIREHCTLHSFLVISICFCWYLNIKHEGINILWFIRISYIVFWSQILFLANCDRYYILMKNDQCIHISYIIHVFFKRCHLNG